MKRNALRTNSAALATVSTSACNMECADYMEHLFFKAVYISFLCTVELVTVEYALSARASGAYISAGVAANTF